MCHLHNYSVINPARPRFFTGKAQRWTARWTKKMKKFCLLVIFKMILWYINDIWYIGGSLILSSWSKLWSWVLFFFKWNDSNLLLLVRQGVDLLYANPYFIFLWCHLYVPITVPSLEEWEVVWLWSLNISASIEEHWFKSW